MSNCRKGIPLRDRDEGDGGSTRHRLRHEEKRPVVVLAATALLVVLGALVEVGQRPVTIAEKPDGGVYDPGPVVGYLVQAPDTAVPGLALKMPKKPLVGQKVAPCSRIEKTINGACWLEITAEPGSDECGDDAYVYNGKCYVAVAPAVKPDVSIGR